MFDYPFVQNTAKLDSMFNKVRDSAVPLKFTVRHWAKLGFSSSQDRGFIEVLKFLGYIDENGVPTNHYSALRDVTIFKEVLAERIRDAYKELFRIDTNVHSASEDSVAAYMARLVNSSAKEFYKQAKTFRALCLRGDFKDPLEIKRVKPSVDDDSNIRKSHQVVFNINLPTTTDSQVYKAIFENLKQLFD